MADKNEMNPLRYAAENASWRRIFKKHKPVYVINFKDVNADPTVDTAWFVAAKKFLEGDDIEGLNHHKMDFNKDTLCIQIWGRKNRTAFNNWLLENEISVKNFIPDIPEPNYGKSVAISLNGEIENCGPLGQAAWIGYRKDTQPVIEMNFTNFPSNLRSALRVLHGIKGLKIEEPVGGVSSDDPGDTSIQVKGKQNCKILIDWIAAHIPPLSDMFFEEGGQAFAEASELLGIAIKAHIQNSEIVSDTRTPQESNSASAGWATRKDIKTRTEPGKAKKR